MSGHILVVDDNREVLDLVSRFLLRHDFEVSTAIDGQEMSRKLKEGRVDLVILDVMLPEKDGLTLCRELRSGSDLPVIMLTAMGDETDRIVGLELGADDYITKPFSPRELLARVRAVLRRSHGTSPATIPATTASLLSFGEWHFDVAKRELQHQDGMEVPISSGEYSLLLAFLRHPNHVLSRDQLLEIMHGHQANQYDRSVDTLVSRLRRKIERDPKNPQIIKTVWNGGYIFAEPVHEQA